MTNDLKAYNPASWLEAIWHALHAYRKDCIPEGGDPAYDEEWSEICIAMAWTREALGLADDVDDASTPKSSSAPDNAVIETALCLWEHLLDREESDRALNQLWKEIGTVEMRQLAISLAPFCCEVFALIPDSLTYDKTYDWDILPAILDTVDFVARPVTPPAAPVAVEFVKTALTSYGPRTGRPSTQRPEPHRELPV